MIFKGWNNYCPCYRCVTFLRCFISRQGKRPIGKAWPKIFFPQGPPFFEQQKIEEKFWGNSVQPCCERLALPLHRKKYQRYGQYHSWKSLWLLASFLDGIEDEPRQNKSKEKNGVSRFLSLPISEPPLHCGWNAKKSSSASLKKFD